MGGFSRKCLLTLSTSLSCSTPTPTTTIRLGLNMNIQITASTTDGRFFQEVFADTLHQPVVLHSHSRHHHPLRSQQEYSNYC